MAKSTRRDLIKKAAVLGVGAIAPGDVLPLANTASEPVAQDHTRLDSFPGFRQQKTTTSGAVINFVVGGNGPGLMLLTDSHNVAKSCTPAFREIHGSDS
jgi:hypothetical protein